jgi:hypothetical protein
VTSRYLAAETRELWILLETVHGITYFSPLAVAARAAEIPGWWRGYFATRAAPLGPVGPGLVTAVFHGFAPRMVARAFPDVWRRTTPETMLRERLGSAARALREHAAPIDEDEVAAVAGLLRRVVEASDPAGRPLGAANAVLPWPDDATAAVWHAATVLREHRGDGHVAVLTAGGLDGCEAHVLRDAADGSRSLTQPNRGWTDEEWNAAAGRLRSRGLLAEDGALSEAGALLREGIERRTDELAATAWSVLTEDERRQVRGVLLPISRRLAGSVLPKTSPVGVPPLPS